MKYLFTVKEKEHYLILKLGSRLTKMKILIWTVNHLTTYGKEILKSKVSLSKFSDLEAPNFPYKC
jgi:hypothetical protein